MKTTKFPQDTLLIDQCILDFKADLLLNIYQIGAKFGFRYLKSDKDTDSGRYDPICESDNYSWGYGLYDSPSQAQEIAHDYYLTHGIHKILQHND